MNDDERADYKRRCCCWWCGGELIWDNDFSSDDVFGDGNHNGIVTFLHCTKCNAEVQYTEPEADDEE